LHLCLQCLEDHQGVVRLLVSHVVLRYLVFLWDFNGDNVLGCEDRAPGSGFLGSL
jgi:hypothetical protein